MNVERSPIIKRAVGSRSDSNNAQLRMLAKNTIANRRASSALIESNHQQIRQGGLHLPDNFRLVRHFADNFDARLIYQRSEYYVPHEFGRVGHENARRSFHLESPRTGEYPQTQPAKTGLICDNPRF